jgi:hypothetical protein
VIAMQMRDKDIVQAREFQALASHRQLRALATVDHHQFVAKVDDLARWEVA